MSLIREIWNDGQALTTPEMQRPCDVAAYSDDRIQEILLGTRPSSTLGKEVMPISRSGISSSVGAQEALLILPGTSGNAGKLLVNPALFVYGTPNSINHAQKNFISAAMQDFLLSNLITSNSSGNPRIDLLYATVSRATPANIASPPSFSQFCGVGQAATGTGAQQSRKIKDVTSGVITSQTINLYDVPIVTLTILQGTPAGSPVAPSLPSDSSTAFNFSMATIAVANAYTSGTTLVQSNITPTWRRSWLDEHKTRSYELPSFYAGGLSEVPSTSLNSIRASWGGGHRFFVHVKILPTTPTVSGSALLLDNTIDWRNRVIRWDCEYLGAAPSIEPLETKTQRIFGVVHNNNGTISGNGFNSRGMAYTGSTPSQSITIMSYVSVGTGTLEFFVDSSTGQLKFYRTGTLSDGTNGDILMVAIDVTDQLISNI